MSLNVAIVHTRALPPDPGAWSFWTLTVVSYVCFFAQDVGGFRLGRDGLADLNLF
jgi:hypothetical protein